MRIFREKDGIGRTRLRNDEGEIFGEPLAGARGIIAVNHRQSVTMDRSAEPLEHGYGAAPPDLERHDESYAARLAPDDDRGLDACGRTRRLGPGLAPEGRLIECALSSFLELPPLCDQRCEFGVDFQFDVGLVGHRRRHVARRRQMDSGNASFTAATVGFRPTCN